MTSNHLVAIYDFEFFPYALGDVLTWNVRTVMRSQELNKNKIDIYICADEKYPASIYQRGLVNPDNFELFFSELHGAFGTNPKLGNLFVFRDREDMLAQLQEITQKDPDNLEAFNDYLELVKKRVTDTAFQKIVRRLEKNARENPLFRKIFKRFVPKIAKDTIRNNFLPEQVLNHYFIKYIYSHESINQFAKKNGSIPLLKPSLGCTPDVDEIIDRCFKGKKIVCFHLRLRRLDVGYGGDHSYTRDSSFVEWYEFLKNANMLYPNIQFVALGRLQEKPLEILRLPNVTSLRIHGMGLGHELTLMLKSDLFIGSSSGFAALANFSSIPYFITRMNSGSCDAYAISEGADRLPFAAKNQKLIYEEETSTLLMNLLIQGLSLPASASELNSLTNSSQDEVKTSINIHEWLKSHANPSHPARTTCRFYIDEHYRDEETAYLLLPYLDNIKQHLNEHQFEEAEKKLHKLKQHFPTLLSHFPDYLLLEASIASEKKEHIAKLNFCETV